MSREHSDRGDADGSGGEFAGVVEAMAALRQRCPWSSTQDHSSLQKFAREETEEVIVALQDFQQDPSSENRAELIEELGDMFYQVLFHSALLDESAASEAPGEAAGEVQYGETLRQIVSGLEEKLIRRHPYTFGELASDTEMASLDDVEREYRRIKAIEKQNKQRKSGGDQ